MIFVWDAITAQREEMMALPKGSRSVSALAFSPDGKYLAAADMSDDHNVHLFDLTQRDPKKGRCVHLKSVKTYTTNCIFGLISSGTFSIENLL